jgi:hypothetical protein
LEPPGRHAFFYDISCSWLGQMLGSSIF